MAKGMKALRPHSGSGVKGLLHFSAKHPSASMAAIAEFLKLDGDCDLDQAGSEKSA
ncbi:hypothetical protein GOZ80_04635 [Agrobacterium vitis]|uniref:hypothetical protein n=1 Tax=Agrobacterium vitis TaxID=373 RepID=UPI0012E76A48|nr:hypothetical protein [Agrobacterium vitis]MVA91310.1 hypothetical protein [Agrobacterium vitis]MVB01080.1 hypothetical protein [Agrobacterium vitis]NSY13205.1 hypothetical protein [Agrobacterium vitis]NSY22962.1 hypothetical protein [Agrobacterium vitis]